MKPKTIDAAHGRWAGVLKALGIDERFLSNRHGPCPLCGGKDRFRFDNKEGNGTWFCNQCGSGNGMKLAELWSGKEFKEIAKEIDGIVGNVEVDVMPRQKPSRKRLREMASKLRPLNGHDPASVYLKGRGVFPVESLFWHPGLKYWDQQDGKPMCLGAFPAMVAPVENAIGQVVSYHVTYLKDGEKAPVPSPKKILTGGVTGCAVRLYPVGQELSVAEGIETALAIRAANGVDIWATLTAHGMETLEVPSQVRYVRIYADNDDSFTGQSAAYALAKRLSLMGVGVQVFVPEVTGEDWLDVRNRTRKDAA